MTDSVCLHAMIHCINLSNRSSIYCTCELTLGGRVSGVSCGARGEEAGEAVVGWPPDLFGEEAGMVERVEMLLGDGELLSGPPTCNHTKYSAICYVHKTK